MDYDEAATIKPEEHLTLLASVNLAGGLAEKHAENKSVPSRRSLYIAATKTKLYSIGKRAVTAAKVNPRCRASKNHKQRSCFGGEWGVNVSKLAKLATSPASALRSFLSQNGKSIVEKKNIQKQKKKEGKMKNVWEQNTHHDLYA